MRMTTREIIDLILKKSPSILQEDKYHVPILFVFGEMGDGIIALEFNNSEAKQKAITKAGMTSAHLLPYCIAFVSEGWVAKRFPPEGKEIHDMPDKEECLIVVADNVYEKKMESAMIPFSRVGGEIILGETKIMDYAESYLLGNYWRGVLLEAQKIKGVNK